MRKRVMHIVTNILVKHLLKAVTIDEILLLSNTDWVVNGVKLTSGEIKDLQDEARSFYKSALYKLLKKEIRYNAMLQRYDHGKVADDMLYGKAMLYDFDLIEKFIRNIIAQK